MPVQPIFKNYPKEIIKHPVMDENNPIYRDFVLPRLKQGEGLRSALIQDICHIPKEKLQANDLAIFLTACECLRIGDKAQFIRDLIFQSIQNDNQELFLLLLENAKAMDIDIDAEKQSWLVWAASHGCTPLLEECLKLGADPYKRDGDRLNAFDHTYLGRAKYKEKQVRLLLLYKEDHTPDSTGQTCISRAYMQGMDCSSLLTTKESDYIHKKVAGHVSSTPTWPTFPFTGGFAPIMCGEIADSLKEYFQDEEGESSPEIRAKLIEAFEVGAKPLDPEAACARIHNGDPTLLLQGWKKHSVTLAVVDDPFADKTNEQEKDNGLLAVCNRGAGAKGKKMTIQVFRINRKKFTPDLIRNMAKDKHNKEKKWGMGYYYQELPKALSSDGSICQDDFCRMLQAELSLSKQKNRHCSYNSSKAALRFLWAALSYNGKEKTKAIAVQVKKKSKRWSLSARVHRLEKFVARFPHKSPATVPGDEWHFVVDAYKKLTKRFSKITDFPGARKRFDAVLARHPLLDILRRT